jgi:hypothetical protein
MRHVLERAIKLLWCSCVPSKDPKIQNEQLRCVPWKQVLCSAEGLRRALYELLCLHGVVLALDSFAWQFTDGISRTKCRERGAGFGGRHVSLGGMRCTVIPIGGRRNRRHLRYSQLQLRHFLSGFSFPGRALLASNTSPCRAQGWPLAPLLWGKWGRTEFIPRG